MSKASLEGWRSTIDYWPDDLYNAIVAEATVSRTPFAQVIRTATQQYIERQNEGRELEAEAVASTSSSKATKEK